MSEHSAHLTSLLIGFVPDSGDDMFVVINFDALAQARVSDRQETSCLPLINVAFEAGKFETPNHQFFVSCLLFGNQVHWLGSFRQK